MYANVLLIEDDSALRSEMVDYLLRRRHRVTACSSIAEATDALAQGADELIPPNAIVSDIRLPDGDGVSFYLENAKRFPDAKWILMSGDQDLVRLASRFKGSTDLPP